MQVVMCEPTARVPPEILQTVQQQLEEDGPHLGADGPGGSPWTSLRQSGLSLEVLGWKFRIGLESTSWCSRGGAHSAADSE